MSVADEGDVDALDAEAVVEPEGAEGGEDGEKQEFGFDVDAFAFAVAFEVHVVVDGAEDGGGDEGE